MGDTVSISEQGVIPQPTKQTEKKTLFVGSADITKLLHDRVGTAIPLSEYETLDNSIQQLHTQALHTFAQLEKRRDAIPLLTAYCDALESSDFQPLLEKVSPVHGAEQLVHVAKGNFIKQADQLLLGAADMQKNGEAVVRSFGSKKSFHSMGELVTELRSMQRDSTKVKEMNTVDDVLSGLEKYMYDGKNLERDPGKLSGAMIIQDQAFPGLANELVSKNIVTRVKPATDPSLRLSDGDVAVFEHKRPMSRRNLDRKQMLAKAGDTYTDNFFLRTTDLPKTVIIDVPAPESLDFWHSQLTYLEQQTEEYFLEKPIPHTLLRKLVSNG